MKTRKLVIGILTAGWMCFAAAGAEKPTPTAVTSNPETTTKVPFSKYLADILKMHQAGVSTPVITAYVKHSPTRHHLSPSEILRLHEEGLPEETITAIIEHSESVPTQANVTQKQPAPGSGQLPPAVSTTQPVTATAPATVAPVAVSVPTVRQPTVVYVNPVYPYYAPTYSTPVYMYPPVSYGSYSYPSYSYCYPRYHYGFYGHWPRNHFGFRFGYGHRWHCRY